MDAGRADHGPIFQKRSIHSHVRRAFNGGPYQNAKTSAREAMKWYVVETKEGPSRSARRWRRDGAGLIS